MLAEEWMSPGWMLLIVGSVLIPGLAWIVKMHMSTATTVESVKDDVASVKSDTKMIPQMVQHVVELRDAHAPGPDGVMEWKNPEIRELNREQLEVLRDIKSLLSEDSAKSLAKLTQLREGQNEVRQYIRDLQKKP